MGRDRLKGKPIRPRFEEPAELQLFGVHTARVVDNEDPENQGRVRVHLPLLPKGQDGIWARVASVDAGHERGFVFRPEIDDEVLLAFEAGHLERPYVLGMLWNHEHVPPEPADNRNDRKVIRTRSGIQLTFDDSSGDEQLVLETPAGQRISLGTSAGTIEIEDNNGNSITLESSGITINASAKVNVNASTVEVSTGMLTVNAGMSKFSGVVQADTVITNSVVSASYTPGAGNIM